MAMFNSYVSLPEGASPETCGLSPSDATRGTMTDPERCVSWWNSPISKMQEWIYSVYIYILYIYILYV